MAAPAGAAVVVRTLDHCRFSVTTPADLAAVRVAAATYQLLAPDGVVPPARLRLPLPTATLVFFRAADCTGYSPPLLPSPGPSRAPPVA